MAEFTSQLGRVEIGPYQPGDEQPILELFKQVFDVDRPIEVWNWEFRDCPEGIHSFVGRLEDGRIVSQFCGIPVRYKCRDQELVFAQMVDSMVHPEYRSGLKRKGLFASTVDAYVERYGHADEEVIMMGLPNPPAFRIGRRLCGYTPMTRIYLQTVPVEPDPDIGEVPLEVTFSRTTFKVGFVDRFSGDLDELWERLSPGYEVLARRDARYMNWRYPDCPQFDYDLVELRTASDNALQGIAVLRHNWLDNPETVIADWFCDAGVPGAQHALLSTCYHKAVRAGAGKLRCLLNHNSEEARFFEDRDFTLELSQFRLVSRTYEPGIVDPSYLNRFWYYTLGDFDVV